MLLALQAETTGVSRAGFGLPTSIATASLEFVICGQRPLRPLNDHDRMCASLERSLERVCNMPAIFGFECPTCGESLGAELPAKKMVITCSACGLDFAVKRPAKDKDVSLPEQQRLSQVNHWRQQRSRSVHKDENGVVDAARVKERRTSGPR